MLARILNRRAWKAFWGAVVEIAFIIFLFFANLLMGEFTRSSNKHGKTLVAALQDIFTSETWSVALIAALIGFLAFQQLRRKVWH